MSDIPEDVFPWEEVADDSRYNVRNFVYVRRRPFHPRRLFDLLHDKFILQHEHDDGYASGDEDEGDDQAMEGVGNDSGHDDEGEGSDLEMDEAPDLPSSEVILANKRAHPLFSRLFRSKGEFWLATRPNRAGEWSQAGGMLTLTGGRPWFCVIDAVEWRTGSAEIDHMVEYDMAASGGMGDRRQELVFIGEKLDIKGVEAALDDCLLTDTEWAECRALMLQGADVSNGGPKVIGSAEDALVDMFDDGFPDWPEEAEGHEGHDHA